MESASGRPGPGAHSPWRRRGTNSRARLPRAMRSSTDSWWVEEEEGVERRVPDTVMAPSCTARGTQAAGDSEGVRTWGLFRLCPTAAEHHVHYPLGAEEDHAGPRPPAGGFEVGRPVAVRGDVGLRLVHRGVDARGHDRHDGGDGEDHPKPRD